LTWRDTAVSTLRADRIAAARGRCITREGLGFTGTRWHRPHGEGASRQDRHRGPV